MSWYLQWMPTLDYVPGAMKPGQGSPLLIPGGLEQCLADRLAARDLVDSGGGTHTKAMVTGHGYQLLQASITDLCGLQADGDHRTRMAKLDCRSGGLPP